MIIFQVEQNRQLVLTDLISLKLYFRILESPVFPEVEKYPSKMKGLLSATFRSGEGRFSTTGACFNNLVNLATVCCVRQARKQQQQRLQLADILNGKPGK